jgi:hypothetical protein
MVFIVIITHLEINTHLIILFIKYVFLSYNNDIFDSL